MSLDFLLCPKCGRLGMSWDARVKVIRCLYINCKHVIKDVIYRKGGNPTEADITEAIERDKEQSND
jgi:hypothetical protein